MEYDAEFVLDGHEDLEMSTQILIRDALKRGVDVTILDRESNFLELRKNGRTELVKQATKTSKDSYISFLIMENKSVTKRLLAAGDLSVPEGATFGDRGEALRYCQSASSTKIVIKPATTNFGIGITIVDPQSGSSSLKSAIAHAFSFAETILVEEFVEGSEYRFLVVDFKCVAVCRRIAANVLGDGVSTVEELVGIKNLDARRGQGHVTPLERIELGETELSVLREDYGYDGDSVPAGGEAVFLRRNSNISTGGDSIDVTDSVDSFYTRVAEQAAVSVDAKICGVDMILTEPEKENEYAILELNFNPVLYIHNYPYQGRNRRVGEKILDLLGF